MELSDRQNWALSAVVGALIAANGVVWALTWEGWFGRLTGGALGVAGLIIARNAVRGLRNGPAGASMEWTTRKSLVNAVVILILSAGLVLTLLEYI